MAIIKDFTDKFGDLISPRRDLDTPIYNWHSFKHSYSRDLVDCLIKEFHVKKGSWVMDSFCGGGTTLLACKQAGIYSVGFDILPFSVFLSTVKTRNYDFEKLIATRQKFTLQKKVVLSLPSLTSIPIAKKAFSNPIRTELLRIKQGIREIEDDKIQDFFNLGLLNILGSVSKTSKSGGFLRLVERDVNPKIVSELFNSRIETMISDVKHFNNLRERKGVSASVYAGDARNLTTKRKFSTIITSPPYPNRHDYSRIYSLEMLFDFVATNEDLKEIRYKTLRSHVEAKKQYAAEDFVRPKILTILITKIKRNGVNNPQLIEMLEGYFEDMYLAIGQMAKHLDDNGKIALVVSNVRFSGVNIPVDEILLQIGEQVGLRPKAIWIARYRGNSSQQMKEYKRNPSRESIVVWEK